MQIGLKIATGQIAWLAGRPGISEREFSGAGNLRISPQIQQQVALPVFGKRAVVYDRENLLTAVSFTTTRKFDSVDQANAWCADYDAVSPREGTLVFLSVLPDGSISRRYLTGAVVLPPERSVTGVSVDLSYQVQGGIITDNLAGATGGMTYPDFSILWEDLDSGPAALAWEGINDTWEFLT